MPTLLEDPEGTAIDEAVLIDFGIAHRFGAATSRYASAGYAAPEIVGDGVIGPPADVYALGALIFHLATGRPISGARDRDQALAWHGAVEPFEDEEVRRHAAALPRGVADVIAAATRLEPSRRITVEELDERFARA
jgi:serine/threonine protein kinase